ncbi:PrpR N-terminal domain-containing protein [Peptoniphilus equinus]|uniref:PrpR N-terminal domain-containing protein n=1 Tax=Peptoniphilus equinus TaxID=3016343 RepID=A0ABY7QTB4_9FIRM|nr:PrpR N-terminal domain-containing protein [Peptoniphilus equinus]WBW49388.1 PrpR N-terminal domain-containing protein [Peptoniphilus equinus]
MKHYTQSLKPIKICFLGYQRLTEIANEVVAKYPFDGCVIEVIDCVPEKLPELIRELATKGFDIYIAGGANAAVFSRYSQEHLLELAVRDVDYMSALKKASKIGKKIAVVWHRLAHEVNVSLLSDLCNVPADSLSYEDSAELYELMESSDYDVFIGASQVCSFAAQLGKSSVLIYAGEETVRSSLIRARHFAIELRKELTYHALNQSLIRNIPCGIIFTSVNGQISLINQIALNYLNLPSNFSQKRFLGDLFPNLSPDAFLLKDSQREESFKIIDGIRFRCTQVRVNSKGQPVGVLTILRIDNTLKNEKNILGTGQHLAKWKELVSMSECMNRAIELGKKYAMSSLPLALVGDVSLHRQLFAESIHTGGSRAHQPLIVINLPQISPADAGRHLLGSTDSNSSHVGLIEMAKQGTIILKNVQDACPAVQDILLDVLTNNQIIPIGGYDPISINVRFISIFDYPLPRSQIRPDLLSRLCTLQIDLPPLKERQEDIPILFKEAISNLRNQEFRIERFPKAVEALQLYSWPGGTSELEAVAGRFSLFLDENVKITPYTIHHMVIESIGEDNLYHELELLYPCLAERDMAAPNFQKAVEQLKYYLGDTNTSIAQKLGISRSSLWRDLKKTT